MPTILLLLIFLEAFVCFSAATDSPAAAPISGNGLSYESLPRKLGNFHNQVSAAPNGSPIAAPEDEKKADGINITEGLLKKHQHRGVDKSVAGGGVILGGLATTFLVAVFCYIRATARHKADLGTNAAAAATTTA
ncbi:hypothetical protein M5689_010075 [Euphorbia peplus]|nr:hypothetical protein M5689_010075 [Euphorbia peplus]